MNKLQGGLKKMAKKENSQGSTKIPFDLLSSPCNYRIA